MNPNIKVVAQKETNKIKRILELRKILKHYISLGYKKIFIRISVNAAIIAIEQAKHEKAEVYFWLSGESISYDLQKKGISKIKYLLFDYSKLLYIKNNINYFVTGPEKMLQYYIDILGVKKEKMLLLYNDIDTNRFQACSKEEKSALRKKLGISNEQTVIMFAHRFSPIRKTYFWIPYIMEDSEYRKENVVFILIGGGPDYEKIRDQVQKSTYGDLVRMIGEVPNKCIMDYYKISDIFINPSYVEGFPRVLIEAMASGLPLVATDAGGTCDIVGTEQKKFIVNKDDPKAFKEGIIQLLKDKELQKQIAEENRSYVKKYSTEAVADMYIERIFC